MEAKRLGLCQKSLFVVPNHLTEQWASEFLRLYPSANILVTTKKDFETHNRKKFCARIATGDYDAIIMGHSQFERIPISRERQERLLYEQIDEITEGIAEVQASGGELRTSNFLLWQSAYAEYYFTDVLWPDFGPKDLEKAIAAYNGRNRRFGGAK